MTGTDPITKARELLAGCEGVTPGPWTTTFADPTGLPPDAPRDWIIHARGTPWQMAYFPANRGQFPQETNAAHIANCDPDTIAHLCRTVIAQAEALELIAEEREMQRALEADGEKLRQLTGEDHGPWALIPCPACDGAGEWDEGPLPASSGATEPVYRQVICGQCDGTGTIFAEVEPITLDDLLEEAASEPNR